MLAFIVVVAISDDDPLLRAQDRGRVAAMVVFGVKLRAMIHTGRADEVPHRGLAPPG
jgi:hypothetical protein